MLIPSCGLRPPHPPGDNCCHSLRTRCRLLRALLIVADVLPFVADVLSIAVILLLIVANLLPFVADVLPIVAILLLIIVDLLPIVVGNRHSIANCRIALIQCIPVDFGNVPAAFRRAKTCPSALAIPAFNNYGGCRKARTGQSLNHQIPSMPPPEPPPSLPAPVSEPLPPGSSPDSPPEGVPPALNSIFTSSVFSGRRA